MGCKKKKVLLYVGSGIDYDLKNSIPYTELYEKYKWYGGNVGNKLYCMAIEKYLKDAEIEYDYLKYDEKNMKCFADGTISLDRVNSEYAMVIMPQANAFGQEELYTKRLIMWTEGISQIKIPVYILGVGAQAESYERLNDLSAAIQKPAVRFIQAVYETGGEFSLRGSFTKELFDSWGSNTAVVTGCPSMYQNGRQLSISNEKVSENELRPMINGVANQLKMRQFQNIFQTYTDSIFWDQDEFIRILYDKNFPAEYDINLKNVIQLVRRYSYTAWQLIFEDRLKLYYDIGSRMEYCLEQGSNFSFGSRIHGNIMSLLWGIPAVVVPMDSRTRELAEYFDIPVVYNFNTKKTLYEIYLDADYKNFNQHFPEKFDNFEQFMRKCGIVNTIKKARSEWDSSTNWQRPEIINQEYLNALNQFFNKNQWILKGLNGITTWRNT